MSTFKTRKFHSNLAVAPVLRTLPAIIFLACSLAPQAWAASEPALPYVVKPSDKLIRLSKELLNKSGDWAEVARFNQLKDPNFIKPGQTLSIPLRLLKSQPSPASLVSVTGDVQLNGAPTAAGASLAEGSRLSTGANSSAVVELGDGSRVKLLPNTLADVLTNRGYAVRDASASGSTTWFSGLVRLVQGGLDTLATKGVQRAKPLEIVTPTALVGVRGTQFRVSYEDPVTKSARAEVIDGLVRADNPTQASGADLARGFGAVVRPDVKDVRAVALLGAPDLAAVPALVSAPAADWPLPVLAGASAFRVQVASDAAFDRIVRDLKSSGHSVSLAGVATGDWYARVRGIDPQGLEGFDAVKLVRVQDAPVPAPSAPAARWRATGSGLRLENGATVLGFTVTGASFVRLDAELSTDAAFTQIIKRESLAAPLWNLGTLSATSYFVRFKAVDAAGKASDSETYRFELPGNWGATVFDVATALQRVN